MEALWTLVAFVFTFGTIAVVGFGIWYALTHGDANHISDSPTVDDGWRAWH